MVERKLYKTKLCVLYQKGHCHRESCSFAHGNAELRRSFNGRQDNRGGDLRDRLDRRYSSPRRNSPGRDARGRHASHGEGPQGQGKMRKKQQLDGHSEDKIGDSRQAFSESKVFLDEQLRKALSEHNILNDHKRKLEIYLEERNLEANSLTSKIQELEMQLNREKEESERITSKMKKFIKAYNYQMHLENELKRSHKQVQKLGEQLSLDFARPGATVEDPGINNRSHEDSAHNHVSLKIELQKNASPRKKKPRVHAEVDEMSNPVNPTKDGVVVGKIRLEKQSRWNAQSNNNKKAESKVSESGLVLPSTSMAAHAMDEVVDIVETEEKFEGTGTLMGSEKEVPLNIPQLPFPPPPPPPIPPNAYAKYKGDNENVDIDATEEETVEVDIV